MDASNRPLLVVGQPGRSFQSVGCGCFLLAVLLALPAGYLLVERKITFPWPMFLPVELQLMIAMLAAIGLSLGLLGMGARLGARIEIYEDRIETEDTFGTFRLLLDDMEGFQVLSGGIRIDTKLGRTWPARYVWLEIAADDRTAVTECLEQRGIARR